MLRVGETSEYNQEDAVRQGQRFVRIQEIKNKMYSEYPDQKESFHQWLLGHQMNMHVW